MPLLGLTRPKVIELSGDHSKVRLPLNLLTKNHLGSMYFGALAMGAELSIALRVVTAMSEGKLPLSFVFKDFAAEFIKRAEGDVDFEFSDVSALDALIERTLGSEERHSETFNGVAKVKGEPVMTYRLTISLKRKSKT